MGGPLKPDFGLNGNVQSFKLCHCDRRRNHSPHLSFRAKKTIRLRMIFTVEEPAFLILTSVLCSSVEEGPLMAACVEPGWENRFMNSASRKSSTRWVAHSSPILA